MPDPVWNCDKDCGWGVMTGFGWNGKLEDPRLPELVSLQEELGEMLPWTRLF